MAGWFLWMLILSQMYDPIMAIYLVRDGFVHNFGPTLAWWVIILLELAALLVLDLAVQSVRRVYFPNDVDLMQRIEKNAAKKALKGKKDADVEMQDVEVPEAGYANNIPETPEPMPSARDTHPDNRDAQAKSMAWTGNAEYYYSNVDTRPLQAPQATYQQPGQAI